ncbi:MAG: hypothetical protein JEZ11_22225 [Desulfobacterales bacterium]|nr:hypothetical protein [Desulfobacterales bacterium]
MTMFFQVTVETGRLQAQARNVAPNAHGGESRSSNDANRLPQGQGSIFLKAPVDLKAGRTVRILPPVWMVTARGLSDSLTS